MDAKLPKTSLGSLFDFEDDEDEDDSFDPVEDGFLLVLDEEEGGFLFFGKKFSNPMNLIFYMFLHKKNKKVFFSCEYEMPCRLQ